jgi:hypothetical protein
VIVWPQEDPGAGRTVGVLTAPVVVATVVVVVGTLAVVVGRLAVVVGAAVVAAFVAVGLVAAAAPAPSSTSASATAAVKAVRLSAGIACRSAHARLIATLSRLTRVSV